MMRQPLHADDAEKCRRQSKYETKKEKDVDANGGAARGKMSLKWIRDGEGNEAIWI